MLLVNLAIIGTILLAIVALLYWHQKTQSRIKKETKIQEIIEKIKSLKGEIYSSVFEYETLLGSDKYISKIEYLSWYEKWKYIEPIVNEYLKLDIASATESEIETLKTIFLNGETEIKLKNKRFIQNELERNSVFFDNIEDHPLTENQRTTIVVDEKNNLVVAGAGTGKTSTIIGKAGYLLKNNHVKPDELLLIAFAKKAKDEMFERGREKIKLDLNVHTFHSLGLSIIGQVEGRIPSLSDLSTDKLKLSNSIYNYIEKRSNNIDFLRKLNSYFAFHKTPYRSEFEFNSKGDYIDYLRELEIRSLKGDLVKSLEELEIANFLYINGIEYIYEQEYETPTANSEHRQYKPDFYLPEKGIYIEHFGVDRNNQTAPFVDREQYLTDMEWKRNIHNQNNTTLIETYSWQKSEGVLLDSLTEELVYYNVKFNRIPPEDLFNELNQLGVVHPFTNLLGTFLNLYKSSRYSLNELYKKAETLENPPRYKAFLDIFKIILEEYQLELGEQIDFNDMINRAENYLTTGKYQSNYKYVLVDEFQDISYSRYSLLKSLLDSNPYSKSFCVGDDWQSIFRFTGSDISIMSKFNDYFNPSEIMSLDKTFRFNNMLCDVSTKFILQNPNQIQKTLSTHTESTEPAVTLHWTNYEIKEIQPILDRIPKLRNSTVFILGRYNHQRPENLRELKRDYPELEIDYYTVHSSKGKQADYVIILGLTSEKYSFPSQIEDDPVLNLVLSDKESIPNAEERRLFYVALTRAKKHVYLVANRKTPSSFAVELEQKNNNIEVVGESPRAGTHCPQCKTGVIVPKWSQNGRFYACNNYPYCEYVAKWCPACGSGFLIKKGTSYICSEEECNINLKVCPRCKDGYLVQRSGRTKFLGCSNFPNCRYTESLGKSTRTYSRRRKSNPRH